MSICIFDPKCESNQVRFQSRLKSQTIKRSQKGKCRRESLFPIVRFILLTSLRKVILIDISH